jgi:two-component system, cell cycle response regulator
MSAPHRLAFVGLSDDERALLASALASEADFDIVAGFDDADRQQWLIADAEHTPSVKLVLAAERLKRTLWVGTPPPMGSLAVLERPLDAQQVLPALRALMALSARPVGGTATLAAYPAAPAPATATKRALLVDDSEVALRFLETRLARWGLAIDCANTSDAALACLNDGAYDFAFIDVELGTGSTLDGLALARHIRRRVQTPPLLVMVSAHHSAADRARGQLAGCDAYLAKPLDEVELQRLLLRHGLKPRATTGSMPGSVPG